ncbi:DNA topoisomerase III [Clostridium fallax]|uniref:DNA topoisomerase 3 n=1 Tax=Clostridium fallax TaxID=1533 RepID=A0A1M4YEM1_9CLOT|nr:DNA topoisomerase III [Clostridium fallax]SHF04274.1 DNA topoisomerase-3 [Clostridium fallax]SQB22318.1 DNA topoisomerase III [Clostridium fallax]
MSKIVVLAEKPSVGRDLARVLKCNKKGNGFLEGEKYIVTWALGHLVTLADPEIYSESYKSWNIADLPIIPERLKLVVIRQSSKQFNNVKFQLNRKDVKEIVIATDAGREGELVARWIIEKSHVRKPIKRLWISSVTDKAIKDGFKNLKDGKAYENLYYSAIARAEADWIVGINATRALTCKYNAQLSCGRVQTPTLAIINKREEEIKNFKPKKFYSIKVFADNLELTWQDEKSKDIKSFNEEKIDNIIKSIKGKECKVVSIEEKLKKSYSPKLYDLTELQRDCNKIFGFSPKETLSIMQKLYEHHKVLTYPRTDSRYITSDIVDTLKDRVKACGVGPYSKYALNILKRGIKASSNFVDNKKVSDHHAIIPTEEKISLMDLNDRERKVYDLVVKRFLAILDKPFEYKQINLKCRIDKYDFIAKGKNIISYGWKEIYSKDFNEKEDDELKEQLIDKIEEGNTLKVKSLKKTEGKTNPPSPFNEATLLSAMENPSRYMEGEGKDLIKTIGETGGLGTVATRADIIEKLFATFLIEKKGKDIYLTSKGRQLLELVPVDLKTPTLTAKWEQKLTAISKGNLSKVKFIDEMKKYSKEVVKEIKNSNERFTHDNLTRSKCPNCGKYMLEVNGKKGKMLVCQDRECGYRKSLSTVTNSRCPNCHKKLELRGEGEGKIFVCSCGYKEKLSAFNERKKKDNSKVSKRDVNKYLKNQSKENDEFGNSALADALSKLKF